MKRIFAAVLVLMVIQSQLLAQKKQAAIKGTWVTNVGSEVLKSKANIVEAVKLCKRGGINNIYVVVWNMGVTMYPSKVVQSYIGKSQPAIYGSRDPIKEIVDEGHKAGIKVHAWFEFGFSYNYGDSNCTWQKRYPHWLGRDVSGKALQKNGFYWWNAMHPEVQTFMTRLVLEVVQKYKVDGVQGDDRLPAMPGEGGYEDYTKAMYAAEHNGAQPPASSKDSAWVHWRADKLSSYGKHLYDTIKSIKPGCIVSWAPSIYPWSKEQYLQDWPAWLKGGYADYIFPQLYRYDFSAYKKIVDELNTQVPDSLKYKIVPGILTSLGNGYLIKKELLQQMIDYNRKSGYSGECTFYFETLRRLGLYY
jgi:uncharacterized lipoprotein YddW (UPF0748 family)